MVCVVVNGYIDVLGYCIGWLIVGNCGIWLELKFDVEVVFIVCCEYGIVVEINFCLEC